MSNDSDFDTTDLDYQLKLVQEERKKLSARIIRFVRRCEASGPAKDTMTKNRRDHQLRELLIDYETHSEVIAMIECERDFKK